MKLSFQQIQLADLILNIEKLKEPMVIKNPRLKLFPMISSKHMALMGENIAFIPCVTSKMIICSSVWWMNGADYAKDTTAAMAMGKGYTTPKSENNYVSYVFSSIS